MVSIMDERARAIFEEARETLARVADVEVEYRFHDDDGMLSPWSRGMPKKPAPPPPLTVADVERKIADGLPGVAAVIHMVRTALRREFADEIAKVKSEHDLHRAALLAEIEKLQRGIGGDRAAEVIDLPMLPRSRRG